MLPDKKDSKNKDELIFELQSRLDEAEQTLNAIQNGEIDAIITPHGSDNPNVFTLESADTIYRNLIEEMGEGVATLTPEGIIFYCNAQLAVLLDAPLDKTIGLRFSDFVVNKDLEEFNSIFNRGLKRKSKGEITIKSIDGTVRPVLISINNLKDQKGVYIVVTDLTEQMHHEELKISYEKLNKSLKDLSRTESLLSAVTNLSSELIYVKDNQSSWIYVNPALERVIGKTSKELLGKNDLDSYSDPEIGRKIIENDKRIMGSGKEETLEEIVETPNGVRQFISVKTPRFNHKKEVIGIVGISHDITDRKKAEETLKRQATLLDASYEAIFSWEYGGEILSWNKGAERLYGYIAEESIGKIGHELLKTEFPVEFEDFISKLGEDDFWKGELIHTTKNGQKIVVETRQQLIQDTKGKKIVIENNRDITERKQIEKDLKKSEQSLAEAQHIAHIGSWEWNLKTGKINCSKELYSIYNVDPNNFTPTMSTFSDYMCPADEEHVNQAVDLLMSEGKSENFDFRIVLEDGSIRVLNTLAEVAKYDENGKPLIIMGINQDITERKKTELKLNENIKKLAESNKELEQFAYITSHDLREPLRMITSFLQLLERKYKDELDQDAKDYIGFAVDGAKRLDAMTNDLLLYSKISRGKRNITSVNFENALKLAEMNLKVQIEESDATIIHDPLPTLSGDESLYVRLFQNLIGNAIKYHGQDNPIIHISTKKEKNQYLFSVKDNGIGMSPNHIDQIFTIFKRLHTHDEYDGTGIGLAIAQKIVHQHGGEIWAESESGKGSTFYFTIPIKYSSKPLNKYP